MQDDHNIPNISAVFPPTMFGVYSSPADADALPKIPTMISTRLRLELLLQDSSVDLREMSEVILSDVGATLQILRLIGEEYPNEEDRPTRIEDCIVSLNRERWYEVVCASGMLHGGPLLAEWQRCRRVAEYARELARCLDGVSPEEAYLVGLLYRLGKFPDLLGWNQNGAGLLDASDVLSGSGEHRALSMMLADYWHLPKYLLAAIQELQESQESPESQEQPAIQQQQEPAPTSRWAEILQIAHQMADNAQAFWQVATA